MGNRIRITFAAATAAVLVFTGCTSNEMLAEQYRSGDGKGYVAGDGTITEVPVAERGSRSASPGRSKPGTARIPPPTWARWWS